MTLAKHVSAAGARLCSAGLGAARCRRRRRGARPGGCSDGTGRGISPSAPAEPPAWFGEAYRQWLDRRAGRERVSQIVGGAEFWGLDFEVTPDVLTPARKPTRRRAGARLRGRDGSRQAPPPGRSSTSEPARVPAIRLARELSGARVIATDVSQSALAVRGATPPATESSPAWHSCTRPCSRRSPARVDLMMANPAYVRTADMAALPPDVRNFSRKWRCRAAQTGGRHPALAVQRRRCAGAWRLAGVRVGRARAGHPRAIAPRRYLRLGARLGEDLQGMPRDAASSHAGAPPGIRAAGPPLSSTPLSCVLSSVFVYDDDLPLLPPDRRRTSGRTVSKTSARSSSRHQPAAPMHVLVIPRRHIATLNDLTESRRGARRRDGRASRRDRRRPRVAPSAATGRCSTASRQAGQSVIPHPSAPARRAAARLATGLTRMVRRGLVRTQARRQRASRYAPRAAGRSGSSRPRGTATE